jgi:hypothetical protein
MELVQCKSLVQNIFAQRGGWSKHIDNAQLIMDNQRFRIQPDDTYIFNNKVIVVEYEDTKRPVESVSKYWWLFEKSPWKSLNVKMDCFVFLLRDDLNEIRAESVAILGKELVTKYPTLFTFRCLMPAEITDNTIKTCIEATWHIR